MKLCVSILLACLFCASIHSQVKNGTIRNGTIRSAKSRTINSFQDNFARANSNPMSIAASDGSGTWTVGEGTFDECKIVDNLLYGCTITENGCRVLSPSFGGNQSATITVGVLVTMGVMLRVQSTTDGSGYLASMDDATHVSIYKIVDNGGSWTYTQLGATVTVSTINTSDTFKFSINGTSMDVYINGVSIGATRTDGTYSSGNPGIYFFGLSGSISAFSATDL